MTEPKMPATKPSTVKRGLIEDIFLYLIFVVVTAFISWFLISTQNEASRKMPTPGPDREQIFLTLLREANSTPPGPKTAVTRNEPLNDVDKNKLNQNYAAYLQAQANLNQRRYDMGAQLVMADVTRKNIGFLIGTLLSLLGCVIIVRRIRRMPVSASGTVSGQQINLLTSSPGVLLVVVGSIMIIATILKSSDVYVNDFDPTSPFVVTDAPRKADDTVPKDRTNSDRSPDDGSETQNHTAAPVTAANTSR